MDDRIWVICISHDYGVWAAAGYFFSEEDANKWISIQHELGKIQHGEIAKDWDEKEDGELGDYIPSEFYAAELKPGGV